MTCNIPLPEKDTKFNEFYTEVKEIEKRDSVLTPKQQIERLLRPGSTYRNLNPFDVLQVEPDTSIEEIKKKYRRLSILVHPDKNQDDPDRAQQAFEAVNKAWKTLENEETRKKCMDIIEEAVGRTDIMVCVFEYFYQIYGNFVDMERKRRELADRDQEERKRKREAEIEDEENAKAQKEWQKNFEESRQNRVNSWQTFTSKSKDKKTSKKIKVFKPPKNKPESRS
ncbi:dnaJ homolog subfamily C member 8 isoform X2 [Leptinotarsa decemlineata]|uniref:dnaJ homolog subfamily C member 8 isoform X2 n=1 Tax=Leptinotarsa decemlineata TaxID=7539 RepID=UPI000C25491F|nr:dnaJ homolog subfamily C member 8 isoform X2 [Leptinotarsa decemlineata]